MTPKKNWDMEPAPNDPKREKLLQESRQHDLHISLTDEEAYAKTHEALQRTAEVLVDATEDFFERVVSQLEREGDTERDVLEVMGEDVAFHVERIATILVREAVKKKLAR